MAVNDRQLRYAEQLLDGVVLDVLVKTFTGTEPCSK